MAANPCLNWFPGYFKGQLLLQLIEFPSRHFVWTIGWSISSTSRYVTAPRCCWCVFTFPKVRPSQNDWGFGWWSPRHIYATWRCAAFSGRICGLQHRQPNDSSFKCPRSKLSTIKTCIQLRITTIQNILWGTEIVYLELLTWETEAHCILWRHSYGTPWYLKTLWEKSSVRSFRPKRKERHTISTKPPDPEMFIVLFLQEYAHFVKLRRSFLGGDKQVGTHLVIFLQRLADR